MSKIDPKKKAAARLSLSTMIALVATGLFKISSGHAASPLSPSLTSVERKAYKAEIIEAAQRKRARRALVLNRHARHWPQQKFAVQS